MKFRDRIVGLLWVVGGRILPAPNNFRRHPERQRDVLRGLLAEIGIAGAGLAWVPDPIARGELQELPHGDAAAFMAWAAAFTGDFQLIDGHLRADEIRDQPMPLLVTDLDEREAAEALATFDPVASLADFDAATYLRLAGEFNSTNAAVQSFVSLMASAEGRMADDAAALAGGQDGAGGEAGGNDGGEASDGAAAGDEGPSGRGERPSLADRFGVPPFSVLDARQGYWQERKRFWLALGIQSELGRGENGHDAAPGGGPMPLDRGGQGPGQAVRGGASPGGSPRPAMKLGSDGRTQRGDGYGRPLDGGA